MFRAITVEKINPNIWRVLKSNGYVHAMTNCWFSDELWLHESIPVGVDAAIARARAAHRKWVAWRCSTIGSRRYPRALIRPIYSAIARNDTELVNTILYTNRIMCSELGPPTFRLGSGNSTWYTSSIEERTLNAFNSSVSRHESRSAITITDTV